MADSVEHRVRIIVADRLGVDFEEISSTSQFADDLGADSLDVAELMMTLEDTFNIEVPDSEIPRMRTVRDLRRFIIDHAA